MFTVVSRLPYFICDKDLMLLVWVHRYHTKYTTTVFEFLKNNKKVYRNLFEHEIKSHNSRWPSLNINVLENNNSSTFKHLVKVIIWYATFNWFSNRSRDSSNSATATDNCLTNFPSDLFKDFYACIFVNVLPNFVRYRLLLLSNLGPT